MKVQRVPQRVVNDSQSRCLGPTTREARVINCPLVTLQVPECTINQRVSENIPQVSDPPPSNQLVSETTPLQTPIPVSEITPLQKSLAEANQYSVLGFPIVHLPPAGESPPQTQLIQRGILPMAETICQSSQTFAGRISLFKLNWKALTQETWVIQTVTEGYQIPLISTPNQHSPPFSPHLSPEDTAIMEEEIQSLLQKQAISQIPTAIEGFYSNMFIVPKKDGGQRPVINLKQLNRYVKSEHFKMEGLHTVKALLRKHDWMAKVDLKDAFFMVPVAPQFRQYLLFKLGKRIFQFNCLPFGLCTALRVFTKILKPAVEITKHLTGNLHGRHASDGRLQTEASRTYPVNIIPSREPVVHRQQQEVHLATHSGNRVSWDDCKLPINGPKITRRENQENQTRGATLVAAKATINPFTIPVSRKAKCHLSSSTNGSPILSLTPDLPKTSSDRQPTELPSSSTTVSPGTGGSSVVGAPPLLLEWKKPDHPVNFPDNNIGCLSTGLGGHL